MFDKCTAPREASDVVRLIHPSYLGGIPDAACIVSKVNQFAAILIVLKVCLIMRGFVFSVDGI